MSLLWRAIGPQRVDRKGVFSDGLATEKVLSNDPLHHILIYRVVPNPFGVDHRNRSPLTDPQAIDF